ncbi:MAG: SDR family oxidoreductase [Proteobacteria bacterium]|nr:SDR family oxidoreductase [Pseudomonadota bacterium]MBU1612609.1 SDR family oxidoreductase [Pseudomonadota bacterium]
MADTILIFGATGQLGQAFLAQAEARGMNAIGVARSGTNRTLDITNDQGVVEAILTTAPALVVNCAAMVSLDACENDPGMAYRINTRPVSVMTQACTETGSRFIQISTDHFFTGDREALHDEDAPVVLLNEYARTKYAAEAFALTAQDALVIRTNITGFRGRRGSPPFAEWIISSLKKRAPLTLFTDFYTSTLDCKTCAKAVLDLAETSATGRLNVAAQTAMNKAEFAHILAQELGIDLDWATTGTITSLPTPRAESLGLDVTRAEAALGYALPTGPEAVRNLVRQSRKDS